MGGVGQRGALETDISFHQTRFLDTVAELFLQEPGGPVKQLEQIYTLVSQQSYCLWVKTFFLGPNETYL